MDVTDRDGPWKVTSRAEAKAQGLSYYYTGKRCHADHDCQRYTSTAQCLECKRGQFKSSSGKMSKARHAKKYRESEKGRRYRLFENAKIRAKVTGMIFDLTIDDIVIPQYCPLMGTLIQLGGDGLYNMDSPSLDRIDNSRGYVKGNVAVISLRANKLKSNLTVEQLRFLAASLASYVEGYG